MSETALRQRQWVSLPGGSCDVRMGTDLLDEASPIFKGAVGKPRMALLAYDATVPEETTELVRRQLTDAGFEVAKHAVCDEVPVRSLEATGQMMRSMADAGLTSDDLVVMAGDVDALSLASYVCGQWCGGTPLVMVPTTQTALVVAPVTPLGIDVGGRERMLTLRPAVKHVLFDMGVGLRQEVDEDTMMTRVMMVVTAMCDSEATFSRLWDRTEALCAGDLETISEQLRDTVKTRGKILSSTALALRQSLTYGESVEEALMRLVDGLAPSTARAEALRFQARLAAGEGMFEVDDVLAQDELLESLGLPILQADVDPAALIAAIREVRFEHSNRFLLGLPRKLGRVRLAAVSDELIAEHVAAWCESRKA